MKVRVAFYKAKGKWVDTVIRLITRSKYSHCELLFEDGRMFSSDAWNGGVRWNTNYNVDNWDILEFSVDTYRYKSLISWCVTKESLGYDYWGVVRFLIPFFPQDPTRWFCSELCAAGLKFIGIVPLETKGSKLSPGDLFELITRGIK